MKGERLGMIEKGADILFSPRVGEGGGGRFEGNWNL